MMSSFRREIKPDLMDQTLQEALELLVVGMTTVALVLGLVVLSGRLLISAVNRSSPKAPARRSSPTPISTQQNKLDPKVIAVLTATVDHVTHGKGRIKSIDSSQ